MKCAWQELLQILPPWLAREADKDGREGLQELRLRLGCPVELRYGLRSRWTDRTVGQEDISLCINTASRYSPWAAQTMTSGFLTAPGGHRIGLCGTGVVNAGKMTGFQEISSLCVRVAREFPGLAAPLAGLSGSILLLGPPGSGKTTLLRDLACQLSASETVAVVDERCELFPNQGTDAGRRLDVLRGCPKAAGISMVLRTMGPDIIAVDEITDETDCKALLESDRCGVRLLATAHGGSMEDLNRRAVYRPLAENRLFKYIVILNRDKTWHWERMGH